jgi:hypothetical protein
MRPGDGGYADYGWKADNFVTLGLKRKGLKVKRLSPSLAAQRVSFREF